MSVFCSHRTALFRAIGDLSHRALDVLRQHLRRFVPTLCSDLRVGQFSVACLGETAMTERGEGEFLAQSGGANDLLNFAAHVGEVRLVRTWPSRPWSAITPIAAQHETADTLALNRVQFYH